MSETVAQQLGCFIGTFIEYDSAAVQLGYKRIIRVNVRIDVRKPIKRRKILTLPTGYFVKSSVKKKSGLKEQMAGYEEENNPIHSSDGLKRPRVQSTVSGVSNKEDSTEVMCTLLLVSNSSRSTGLGSNMDVIRCKCGFQSGFDIESNGQSGGLSLGCHSDYKVLLRSFSRCHIDVMIDEDTERKTWRCTGFYGVLEKSQRDASWNLLRPLDDCPYIHWLVIGNFNEILYSSEKKGGLPQRELQMTKF
ncbi:hypothetical protein J1N35_018547 [Gossypium stocksii]|uniref:DUF4283 domain-containing protein n=1 Tax=Gossypium stocksii TaxID=47602 RepID=A0A9D3VQR1_9ROSI|nr:hypothetical protein J1N35_018547 [Gossypium stocksii]